MGGGLFGFGPTAEGLLSDTHSLRITSNSAGSDGGGIALGSLAKLRSAHAWHDYCLMLCVTLWIGKDPLSRVHKAGSSQPAALASLPFLATVSVTSSVRSESATGITVSEQEEPLSAGVNGARNIFKVLLLVPSSCSASCMSSDLRHVICGTQPDSSLSGRPRLQGTVTEGFSMPEAMQACRAIAVPAQGRRHSLQLVMLTA